MHIYHISTKNGIFEAHAVGRNARMAHRHSRAPSVHNHNGGSKTRHGSSPRPPMLRWESNSAMSDAESDRDADVFSSAKDVIAPLTPTTSVASTPSTAPSAFMFPPPSVVPSANNSSAPASVVSNNPSSRRSSFSGSNAPSSPQVPHPYGRYGRSPSPMPPLPAIRTPLTPPIGNIRLYGDESFTNFFRRLTFSPDGGLLLTPAGQFEDPSVIVPPQPIDIETATPTRGRKGRQSSVCDSQSQPGSNSCVYIYSRANFARPPIAQLPGHKKASVAVRFSPVLYELRSGVVGPAPSTGEHEAKTHSHESGKVGVIDKGVEGSIDLDIAGPTIPSGSSVTISPGVSQRSPQKQRSSSQTPVMEPAPRRHVGEGSSIMMSPTLPPVDAKPPTPAASKPPTPAPSIVGASSHTSTASTGSVFASPYRMLFAVVTMDTLTIYDTQQSSPFCLLTKLHYDEFTDVSW